MIKPINITELINETMDEVSASKLGPMFYSVERGVVKALIRGLEEGTPDPIHQNNAAHDCFKICLMAKLGIKIRPEESKEGWQE